VGTGVFVQVRLGSTRLPSKALLPLEGGTVIQHVMRCVREIPAEARALLTDAASAESLGPVAAGEGFSVMVGPDEDVLARFCMAARRYGVERMVRVTGDNPLTSGRLARGILALHERSGAHLSHYLGNPWGTGVEIIQSEALLLAEREARGEEREHITTWMYRHRDLFVILEPEAPPEAHYAEGRMTVDTPRDYERVRALFRDLYRGRPIEAEEAIHWMRAHADGQPEAANAG
jgi:spore coat polysaccharide biosynthesis protein SpsF